MLSDHIATQIYNNFAFPPTEEQKNVINSLSEYIMEGDRGDIFILNGYAGTGKTSIVGAFVGALKSLGIKYVLMAPTGRAAKVMSQASMEPAFTIHKKIYRQKIAGASGGSFSLDINRSNDTIYIVDEASMLSNFSGETSSFGSGRLIDDLLEYVNTGDNNRLILVGDDAQLPPVGLDFSPALNPLQMQGYGTVYYNTLHEVVRQQSQSGILANATTIRLDIDDRQIKMPSMQLFKDVRLVDGTEMIDEIEDAYRQVGREGTIVICRSNKRAGEFNRGIRTRVLDMDEELSSGDMLMVVKNNYYYPEIDPDCRLDFIANGDVAIVERVRHFHSMYGCRYAEVQLRLPDYDDYSFECMVLLESLHSDAPSLSREQSERLFRTIEEDYTHIGEKRKRYAEIMKNEYWNALQVKFAYAVTCHKAQGGQWQRVFIDRLLFGEECMTRDFQRWLYTAVTRATEQLYFVNWPEEIFKKIKR